MIWIIASQWKNSKIIKRKSFISKSEDENENEMFLFYFSSMAADDHICFAIPTVTERC